MQLLKPDSQQLAAKLSLLLLASSIIAPTRAPADGPPQAKRPPAGEKPPADDLTRLQGTWTLLKMEIEGEDFPIKPDAPQENAMLTPIIRGDTWMEGSPGGKELVPFLRIKLFPTSDPKQIDLIRRDQEEVLAGLYKIEGDTLTLCVTVDKDTPIRPTRFTTKKDLPLMLCIYKRK